MQTMFAPTRAAAALITSVSLAAMAGGAFAEGIDPNPAQPGQAPGTPITGVTKTPTHLCQPGTMRFVATTRQLSLPNQRYCTDADWSVRDVRVEGANLLWRVPFTNGQVDCACTRVAGTPTPPGPPAGEQPTTGASDRITAGIVARELRAMGLPAEVNTDSGGDPRIATTVDGYKWAIFFYGCPKTGDLEQRQCLSLQLFSGYTLQQPASSFTMNKWNSENRYTRGYTGTSDQGPAARISMDVMFGNTGADPVRNFRAYFNMMKHQNAEFRKLINFQ